MNEFDRHYYIALYIILIVGLVYCVYYFTAFYCLYNPAYWLQYLSKLTYLLTSSSIHYNPQHPSCSIYVPDSLLHNLSPSPLWSTSWSGTLHIILQTFLYPIIVFFSQQMTIPYDHNLFSCSTEITSSIPRLHLNSLT